MTNRKKTIRTDCAVIIVCLVLSAILLFRFGPWGKPPAVETPQRPVKGRIAIILDDWGYNAHHCDYLAKIEQPLTVSILPLLAFSEEVASCARANGKTVMLHLPMEPHKTSEHYPRDYILKTTMSNDQVTRLFHKALASVPGAEGINNHMGSKATEDRGFMRKVFTLLNQNKLFFVDSRASVKTVCPEIARKMGTPFIQRDIFLDNQDDRSYIEGQLALAALEAKQQGYAVVIGHDRQTTLETLIDELDYWESQGFEFVPITSLLKD